jgi:hypothetical protein
LGWLALDIFDGSFSLIPLSRSGEILEYIHICNIDL